MITPAFLVRLAHLLVPPPLSDPPRFILRDMDAPSRQSLEAMARDLHRPLRIQIHPLSELTEYRDRLLLATFPPISDKSA